MKLGTQLLIVIMGLVLLISCAPEPENPQGNMSKPAIEKQPIENITPESEPSQTVVAPSNASNSETEPDPAAIEKPVMETIEEPKPCGSFFDAYTRITGGPQDSGDVKESDLAALLAARMKEHDVGCAMLVTIDVTNFDSQQQIRQSIDFYADILRDYPGIFFPLMNIDTNAAADFSIDLIEDILAAAEGKIAYQGLGEVSFVDPGPWKNKKFTDEPLPELIEFFGEREMIVAAHIARGQTSDLKNILTQYPNTKILVHGYPDGIKDLLMKHKNLYYAAELEIMAADGTFSCSSISTSTNDVENAFRVYGPIIAAAPEQVLWATNAHSKCHFQPGFYSELIEFSNKFIEKLPEEHRDKFAYENAERLINQAD